MRNNIRKKRFCHHAILIKLKKPTISIVPTAIFFMKPLFMSQRLFFSPPEATIKLIKNDAGLYTVVED